MELSVHALQFRYFKDQRQNNSHTKCHCWHCMCAFKLLFVVVFHLRRKNVCFFRVTSFAHFSLYVPFKLFFFFGVFVVVVGCCQCPSFGGVVIMIVEWLHEWSFVITICSDVHGSHLFFDLLFESMFGFWFH